MANLEEKLEKICATSSEYILSKSHKPCTLPETGGQKFFKPDSSQMQTTSLEAAVEELATVLEEERVVKKNNLSTGEWSPERKVVLVETMKGRHWKHFGTNVGGKEVLLPEEALFLVDQGLLQVHFKSFPMSVQEAYAALIPAMASHDYYQVFAYLCRLGFAVQRYQRIDSSICVVDSCRTSEHGTQPDKVNTNEFEIEELSVGPVGHLWNDGLCQPLIMPKDASNTAAILSKLQVVKNEKAEDQGHDDIEALPFKIDFNVFQTGGMFKKSDPGTPDCRICICKYTDPPPSPRQFSNLLKESAPVPVKFAVVHHGSVSFYGIMDVDIPTLISLG